MVPSSRKAFTVMVLSTVAVVLYVLLCGVGAPLEHMDVGFWLNPDRYRTILSKSEKSETVNKPISIAAIGPADKFHFNVDFRHSFQECYTESYLDRSMTCNTDCQTNRKYNTCDAIVFRGTKYMTQNVSQFGLLPRIPDQWWIFTELEAPPHVLVYNNLTQFDGLFNLTSTFALDSDIPRYDRINARYKRCVKDPDVYASLNGIDYTQKKTRKVKVAWFVSHCETQSKREEYVKELQKYIDVDIYGKCGPLKCPMHDKELCNKGLLHKNKSYKFYLSFENSLCEDYVTEKFWKALKLDVIPVVMGLVDYSNIMPKDTYIDVRDFSSPKALAQYLHHLDQDNERYNQYIRNKNSLVCNDAYVLSMPWECFLCKRLHEMQGTRRIVYHMDRFWGSKRCVPPSEFYNPTPDNVFTAK